MCCVIGMVTSLTPPKLENFFGGVTMGTPDSMYYNQNPDQHQHNNHRHHQQQIQTQNYQDYNGFRALYQTVQQEEVKEAHISAAHNNLQHHHLPSIGEDDDITGMKNWISRNYHSGVANGTDHGHSGYGDLHSLSLSMSFGTCSQSNPCVTTASSHEQQIIPAAPANNVTDCVVMDTKKRGSEKVDQQKQIVHRKSLDTFGQRTSQYRGVTRFISCHF